MGYESSHQRWLVLIACLALCTLVVVRWQNPAPAPRISPPQGNPLTQAQWRIDRSTTLLLLSDDSGIYQDQLGELAQDLQQALSYVSQRTALSLVAPVRVVVSISNDCVLNGATYSEQRLIQLWSCAGIPRQRLVNIAAHEFVHQLAQDHYGAAHLRADLLLSEGLATWGAGSYWLGELGSFDEFARLYRAQGYRVSLATHYQTYGSIEGMNALYYQWASFVDFLLRSGTRVQFDQLYSSGTANRPGSAAYQTIYGRDLATLQSEWERQLGD